VSEEKLKDKILDVFLEYISRNIEMVRGEKEHPITAFLLLSYGEIKETVESTRKNIRTPHEAVGLIVKTTQLLMLSTLDFLFKLVTPHIYPEVYNILVAVRNSCLGVTCEDSKSRRLPEAEGIL